MQRRLNGPDGRMLPVTFWYPATAPETLKKGGVYELSAAFDAEPAPGRFGVIAISHGSGGSALNHHDFAAALARAGYIVVAPGHVGDRPEYRLGGGTREQVLARPAQLAFAVWAVLDDSSGLGRYADRTRMGVMGFSAGGYTALVAAGGRPDFSLVAGAEAELADVSPECWREVALPGVSAAVLLAPFSRMFDAEGLADVGAKILIVRAAGDQVTPNAANADRLAALLHERARVETVPGGHYVFIAPALAAVAKRYPEYYVDGEGVERSAIHVDLAEKIVQFFNDAFSGAVNAGSTDVAGGDAVFFQGEKKKCTKSE